jgi:predicted unusual protein kinase regulating ubiquinone biosynthesis (AarF/ABC1/UbiB family)
VGLWLLDVTRLRRLGGAKERLTRPQLIRLFCEDMGPTFIKFGQIVASSSGMFPKRYVEEFRKCLDRVRPFSFAEVEVILADELGPERKRLTEIEPKQLASASIAQVHTAVLDGKEKVVVKVQRPGIERRIRADMRIMKGVAWIVSKVVKDAELANPVGIVEDFAETLGEELDFRKEAKNLDQFNEIMHVLNHTDVRAPTPRWEVTTKRVLTMERFYGTRVDDVEAIHARKVDAEGRLIKGMQAWFQCVLFHGFFHGDVHAGNLMLLDNDDVGFLDFGIVGRFNEKQRIMVTDYIVAFASGDYASLARVIHDMGSVESDIDQAQLAKDLEGAYKPLLTKSFADINYAELLPQIQKVASKHQMYLPKEFVLITKQMLYFDRYAKLLAPKLNVFTDPRLVMSLMQDLMKLKQQVAAQVA